MKKVKRFLALFLAVMMVLTSADFSAFAAENSANPDSKPQNGTTTAQPFISGTTGGSTNFRIPAMVTLNDGRIVAAADARWNTSADGGGLDTIVSWSADKGKNWNYTVANYLGDNGNEHNTASTAFIDPVLATDGTNVYMVVDLWPAGYALNGATAQPDGNAANGFDDANGNLRLSGDDRTSYGYYLKKKDNASADDYYAIMQTGTDTVVEGYTVDAYFNIKSVEETETTVSEGRDTAYSADDRFQFPDPGQTETLEAEYMVLHNTGENEAYPLVIETGSSWASNGKFVNSLNSGDTITLYYYAPRPGNYTATVTYRSGSDSNGFSWAEASGNITAGSVTMGASDEAGANHTGTFNLEVINAGAGALVITGGERGGPQIDKIEIKAAFAEHQYSEDDRFQFPDAGETKLLEAEYMELHNIGENETWPMKLEARGWASNGTIVDAMGNSDYIDLYYNAPKAGNYTATFTYRSGSTSNGFSWTEVSGENPKITAGSVTMGASDEAGANHEGVVTFEVLEAGEGILRLTGGSSGGPQLDKIEFSFTTVPVDTNLFCADSPFKVYPTDYLYLTKSTDGGATWGAPTLINAKKEEEQSYLVGPGAGLVTTDDAGNKTIIIPCYVYDSGTERASFIYSKDDGATWTRTDDATDITSSEAQLVELEDGTLRCFFRNRNAKLCYVDAEWDAAGNEGKGEYVWGDVVQTDVVTSSYTQLSAISYSKRIDGKEAILVSCPTGPNEAGATGSDLNSRRNGKIFVGLVQKDGSMKWPYSMNVTSNEDYFLYSCMAELQDGSIGILYEPSMTEVTYANYTMAQIAPGANVTDLWVADAEGHAAESVVLKQGTSADFTVKGVAEDADVTVTSADPNVAAASLDGSSRTLTITAVAAADNAGISTAALIEDAPALGDTKVTVESGNDTIVLDVTVDDFEKDATISVGETIEIEGALDASSSYDTSLIGIKAGSYDSPVVVDISTLEVGESTNMLFVFEKDGNKYVLTSTEGTKDGAKALGLTQINANTNLSEYYWTVTGVTGGYTIQAASGEKQGYYITTDGNDIFLDQNQSTVFSFEDGYKISYLNSSNQKRYFNNYSAGTSWIAGWEDHGNAVFSLWKTGTVITGLAVGKTDVIVDGVTYHVTVEPAERYVTMYVGDKAIYDGQLESNTNESVINTEENDSSYPYSPAKTIENGGKYLILNAPKNRIVDAISESSNKRPYVADVISETVLANTYYSEHLWTFTLVENTTNEYYVQNADGKYLSIETNQNVNLVDHAEVILLTETSNSEYSEAWDLKSKTTNQYLNNNGGTEATNNVISYGSASPWYLYAPTKKDVTVVTAETVGTSDVTIGTTLYHITVKEPVGTYSDTVYVPEGETVEKRHGSAEPDITVSEGYDTAIVTAALSEDQATVSFTGVAEGRTVVDVGPMRYYVYVTKAVTESIASTEDVVVYVGQTKNLVSTENGHTPEIKGENFDKYLANYTLKGVHQDLLAVRGDTTISLNGNSAYYIGTPVDLSDCLYTFTNTGTANTYYITSVDSNGQTVYLHHALARTTHGNNRYANMSEEGQILLQGENGVFYLNDNTNGSDRYLYFIRNGQNLLDGGDRSDGSLGYQFNLYRPATAEEIAKNTDSAELPGYVKVSALTDIKDGGQYLIVASYTLDGNTYHYAVYPSLETNHNHTQTVQIITDPISGNKFSSVTFTGLAAGETTLQVDTKMYNITVLPKPDVLTPESTPFISETGQSAGSAVTKLTISADRTFDLTIGNGYPAEDVTWTIIDDETGEEAEWATVNPDGVVAFGTEADSTVTHNGRIVAEINGVPYEIPLRIAPKHTGTSSRSYDIYIKDLHHTDVYYGWIYQYTDENNNPAYTATTLVQAVEGAVLYVNLSTAVASAIDFFAEPEEGYVLTQMGATGSSGHYMKLDGTTPADTEFCTAAEGHETEDLYGGHPAGYQQLIRIDEAATTNLVGQAMAEGKECDGAQGFTRYVDDENGLSTVLTYRSEKLPTVTKSVKGILGKDGLASSYRTYTDGMTAQVGEYVYFEVIVETYDAEDPITYTDVKLKDTLAGASFYEKDPDAEVQRPVYNMGSEIVITDAVGADGAAKTGNQHIYYAVYQIQEEDVAKQTITNHVELEYDYDSEYSTGAYHGAAAADAAIVVTDVLMDDIVIDFGLPVQNTCITNGRYFKAVSEPIATTYGTVTVTARETGETTETTDAVKQYENVVTYTPTGMLTGVDTVTLTLVDEADGTESSYTFYVYPASSVYYEEDFAEYSEGWTISDTATNTAQNLQRLSDAAAEPYGYDSNYADDTTGPSNGTEKVSETAGQTAEFTFAGRGIDIYANCQGGENPTGSVTVLIRNQETQAIEKLMIVNTIVAGNTTGVTDVQNTITNAYHLPIVSVNDLSQGEYGVKIAHTRTKTEVNAGKTYPVKLDGFRVYNTLEDQSVYADHEEANPFYVEMRDVVLNALSISDLYDGTEAETDLESIYAEDIAARLKQVLDTDATEAAAGIVMNSTQASGYEAGNAQDLLDNGPKNELFLYEGDTLAFKLLGGLQNVQIGLKAVNGPVSVSVSKQGETATAATTLAEPASITSSTDMFYVLGDMDEDTVITIANTGESVLSVTDIKCFFGIGAVAVFGELSEDDFIPMLTNMGYSTKTETAPEEPEDTTVEDTTKEPAGNTDENQTTIGKEEASADDKKDTNTTEAVKPSATTGNSGAVNSADKNETEKPETVKITEVAEVSEDTDSSEEVKAPEELEASEPEEEQGSADVVVSDESEEGNGAVAAIGAVLVLAAAAAAVIFGLKKKRNR